MTKARSASPILKATPAEAALRELIRVEGLLKRVLEPYFARFGISPAQWGILRALQRSEEAGREPPRLTDLCALLLVRPPSVSGVVDRLERMGLVAKAPFGGDKRARGVGFTDAGRRLVGTVLTGHGARIAQIMGGLDTAEQTDLLRLLKKLGAHLEPAAERADGVCAPTELSRVGSTIESPRRLRR
jgi:DNA-binding MarR family transcriptional regulator